MRQTRPLAGLSSDALAVRIHAGRDGARADAIGFFVDHGFGRPDDRREGFKRLHHRPIVRRVDDRTGGVGDEIEQRRFRPLAVELGEGGEHAASELRPGNAARAAAAMSSTVGFSGRLAPGCQDFRSAALETTIESISRRARFAAAATGSSDDLASASSGTTTSRTIFAAAASPTCRIVSNCRESRAVPHIGMTDEEASASAHATRQWRRTPLRSRHGAVQRRVPAYEVEDLDPTRS